MIESALYHCSSCMTMMPWAPLWVTSSDGVRVKRSSCLMPALKASRHMSVQCVCPRHRRAIGAAWNDSLPHLGLDKFGRLFGLKDDDGVGADAGKVAEQLAAKMPVVPPLLCDRYIPVQNLAGLVAVAIRAPPCVP